MEHATVQRNAEKPGGRFEVPGDKSISHRVAMLAGLSAGPSDIEGFLCSEDCLCTLHAMEQLGAEVERDGSVVRILGNAGKFSSAKVILDMGNSGTGIRLMAGLLAGTDAHVEMTGDASLMSRPMGRIQKPLALMGADIDLLGEKECGPVVVKGTSLTGISYRLPMASAQVKSAVLLAGLCAKGITEVIEPSATRDHTELALQSLGVPVEVDGLTIRVRGNGRMPALPAGSWNVPGDISSAAFFFAAAAMTPGAEVTIQKVGLNPRRATILHILERMGAEVFIEPVQGGSCHEPWGNVTVRGGELVGTVVEGDEIPGAIDELPLVAAVGALAKGITTIKDARELRVKESDRIECTAENLRRMGVPVDTFEDGMTIQGVDSLSSCQELESFGDHRIVMAFSILALKANAPVSIRNTACVNTSFPEFWECFQKIGGEYEKSSSGD